MAWYSFVSSLFTAKKVKDSMPDIFTSAVDGIDKLILTKEEKLDFNKDVMNVWLEGQKLTIHENTWKSLTRRSMAKAFAYTYLGMLIISASIWRLDPEFSKHIFDTAKVLGSHVMAIVIFYFGYYAGVNLIKAKNGK